MTDQPLWETEPSSLDFEAEGLRCAMRRNGRDVWCGYVGVESDHPLFGLPTNHPLALPASWFEGRKPLQGSSPLDLFCHIMSGAKQANDNCPISLAMQVHGGCNYAADHVPDGEPDGRWWFGFDCGHAGDYTPGGASMKEIMKEMIDSMPEHVRETMRDIVFREQGVYRDQQYVVGECQSLAAQLNAIVGVIMQETVHGGSDRRRD